MQEREPNGVEHAVLTGKVTSEASPHLAADRKARYEILRDALPDLPEYRVLEEIGTLEGAAMATAKCVAVEHPRKWPVLMSRIDSAGRAITTEDMWNAAVRAGADPARLALSLSHVLGEVTCEQMAEGMDDEPVLVRYTLETGQVIEYDASFPNPFANWRRLYPVQMQSVDGSEFEP